MKNFNVIFLRSLFFPDLVNKTHTNKSSNNNVYQIDGRKKQNSDKILTEIHTNFQKHTIEMKGNMAKIYSINGYTLKILDIL